MIHEVTGDILKSRADLVAHGVAPDDSFNQGLALSLRDAWPSMVKDYRHWCKTTSPHPGQIWVWSGVGGVKLANLLTQEAPAHAGGHPGRATLAHVNHALRELRKEAVSHGARSLALPRLATGVGGLEWEDVKPLVERHLGDLDIPVYVYTTYKAGVEAAEPA
jgi:O-acetyl-ADP-ribose deacetylase (regulator of RNase III)